MTDFDGLSHSIEQRTLPCKQINSKIENGNCICQDQVAVRLLGSGEERRRIILGHGINEAPEPGHIPFAQNVHKGNFKLNVLLQRFIDQVDTFERSRQAFLTKEAVPYVQRVVGVISSP